MSLQPKSYPVAGVNVFTVASRLRRGWDFERAVSHPLRGEA